MSAASGVYKDNWEAYEINSFDTKELINEPYIVTVYTNQTILNLKTNLGILLSKEGYVIDDNIHDIEIYIDGIRIREDILLSDTNLFETKKVYFKKCEQKHKYLNITMKDYSRPILFKVHQDDIIQTLIDKIAKDLLIKSDKVKLIFAGKIIDNTISIKDSNIFDTGYVYVHIE